MRRLCLIILLTGITAPCDAANTGPRQSDILTIGTKPAAPFVIRGDDGSWSGISIDLWRGIAEDLQLPYIFEQRDLAGLVTGLEDGSLDAAIAAITITAEREERIDFTHPFYNTGLSIAVSPKNKRSWMAALERFLSIRFLQVIAALLVILLATGILAWFFERRRNPDQFGGKPWGGIGAGFWWAAVTMTTVGYGDKAPKTLGGRMLGLIWMFVGVIIISSFTAAITTALTVTQLESRISGPNDLPHVRVATVNGSTSEMYLSKNHISFTGFESPDAGLQAVANGDIDAMVYDAPILRSLANTEFKGKIHVLPGVFDRQNYGIGLPAGSPLRESLNRALLRKIAQPGWQEILVRYLGA